MIMTNCFFDFLKEQDVEYYIDFDMYRISGEDDLYSIGFYDYLDRRGVCLTEWSENIEESLPESYVRVEITKDDPTNTDSRSISIELVGIKK